MGDLVRFREIVSSISPHRRRKYLILTAVLGVSGYGIYRFYNSPYVATKTKRLTKLLGSIVSFAEMVIDSSETISLVTRDLKEFLESDSNEIPKSLKQLAKITNSKEFTDSLARLSESVTIGIFHGYSQLHQDSKVEDSGIRSNLVDRICFSDAGTGFISVVVGSFAKNLVLGYYSITRSDDDNVEKSKPKWMDLLFDDKKCREVLAECIERFTSSAVSVYIEKTVGVNTYDQIFSGLTNPKHRDSARDVLVSVCNGALETFMRTSHQVLTTKSEEETERSSNGANGWAEALTTTLAVPSNRKFMFDVTGRVTLETMRSIVEFVISKTSKSCRRSVDVIHDEVTERGRQVVGYIGAKTSVIITVCLAVYLHIVNRCVRGSPVFLNQHF